jgi:hypothetical protein
MLLLTEYQIYHPATSDVRTGAATVVEDLGAFAPGVLKCIGQNRHRGEVTRVKRMLGAYNNNDKLRLF